LIVPRGGLERYWQELSPALAAEIAGWSVDPELGKLHASLQSITDRQHFLDTCAEAVVARYLLRQGCRIRVEVLTPTRRSCDFEVAVNGRRFFLHVKRLTSQRPLITRLAISSRLRNLERINRPYVVGVHLPAEGLPDHAAQRFVRDAAEFIRHARVGDELVIRDADGSTLGGCRVIAPGEGRHVSLVIRLPEESETLERARRLLRKAFHQFMPGATNVVLIGSAHVEDAEDIGTALLGSYVERWDAVPPEGRRVAHGRAGDGFWREGGAAGSQAAGWFFFDPARDGIECRLWLRAGASLDPEMEDLLKELFAGPAAG
jgi:hypothetical protein